MPPGARGGQRHRDRYRNLRGVATGRARFVPQRRDPLPQRLRRHPERLPAVAEAHRAPDGRAADAADHDGDRRFLQRLGRELHPVEARVLAFELRLVLGPQGAHHGDRLVGEGAALRIGAAHRADLLLDEPDTDAHDEPAAAQHVERRRRLREPHGIVVRQHQHRGAQAYTPRSRCHVSQKRQRLVIGLAADPIEHMAHVEHVVMDPDRVDASLLGAAREIDQHLRIVDAPVIEQREPELHWPASGPPRARLTLGSVSPHAAPAGISAPHGSMAGRSGVNSFTRPAAPLRIVSIFPRSSGVRSSSVPASFASTSAGVLAPTSAVLIAGLPSTHASAIWLSGTPRGSAISLRRRSTTLMLVLKFSPRKIGWPNATPPPRQSRAASPKSVAAVKAPVSKPWPSEPYPMTPMPLVRQVGNVSCSWRRSNM